MATMVRPSISNLTSTASRVVPGISETITRGSPARALTSVLLPELRLPMMAIARSGRASRTAVSSGSGRSS